jgi:class 3 adenylate cyclase
MRQLGTRTRRSLVTVLFTDIVGSTVRATELGDRAWRELLARHHGIVRRRLRQHHGREVDTAGDGFLSVFDAPAEAVLCACDIRDDVRQIGLEIRAGLHTGEIETAGEKVSGIAVHTAARVLATAGPSEVLVSGTVRDIVAGAELVFEDRGTHELKGIPGEWHLYAADRAAGTSFEAEKAAPAGGRWRQAYFLAGVASVAVAAIVGAVLVAGGSPPTQSPPPSNVAQASMTLSTAATPATSGPNMVGLIDPSSGEIVGTVRVGAGPDAIVSDGSSLWVGNVRSRTVSTVSAATAARLDDLGQFGTPTSLAFGDGYVWVADGLAGNLYVIDPLVPNTAQALIDGVGADGLAFGNQGAWISDDIGQHLWKVDSRTLLRTETPVDLSGLVEGPGPIAFADGSVWVVDRLAKKVVRFEQGQQPTVVALRVQPTAIAVGLGYVWALAENEDAVVRIDPATNQPLQIDDVGNGPQAAAEGDGVMWLGLSQDRSVVTVSADGTMGRPVAVGGIPSGLCISAGRLWVTLQEDEI